MDCNKVLNELDLLFSKKELEKIEPFLQINLANAMEEADLSTAITITNELIGFYRDTSQYQKAEFYCDQILILLKELNLEGTIPYATTLLNVANAFRASGRLDDSLSCYQQARTIYDKELPENDFRNASFYNNLSLLYQEKGDYNMSCDCLSKALSIAQSHENAQIEVATTHANLATSFVKCNKLKEASNHANLALKIFEKEDPSNYHYSAALSAMADIYYLQNNMTDAIPYYERAASLLKSHVGETKAYKTLLANLEEAKKKLTSLNELKDNKIKGVDLSESYYREFGRKMIHDKFLAYESQIAIGLVGEGSECFGLDDSLSSDHDFEPGFCIWLTKDTYEKIGEALQIEYNNLPTDYLGYKRKDTVATRKRHGVFEINSFYQSILGDVTLPLSTQDWMKVAEDSLKTATNGVVFRDDLGEFSNIRNVILAYYPKNIWLTKISEELAFCAQTGQYNYARMMARKDIVSANLYKHNFIEHALNLLYLINKTYRPYQKWLWKESNSLTKTLSIPKQLEELSILPTNLQIWETVRYSNSIPNLNDPNISLIEEISAQLLSLCKVSRLLTREGTYMADHIPELLLRTKSKEQLVDEIITLEWNAFDQVKNQGGRADCQNDLQTFTLMRKSQYLTWTHDLLISFILDFYHANQKGWNLITEKYAWMMESTSPDEFIQLEKDLPKVTAEKKKIMEEIIAIQVNWMETFASTYPKMATMSRHIHTYEDSFYETSYETYLRGELRTYSDDTLVLYGKFIVTLLQAEENLAKQIMTNTALLYGYQSLEDAEAKLSF